MPQVSLLAAKTYGTAFVLAFLASYVFGLFLGPSPVIRSKGKGQKPRAKGKGLGSRCEGTTSDSQ